MSHALAQTAPGDALAPLPEEVILVPKKYVLGTLNLEVTVFRPPGSGPFPLAVINHGKASGNPRFQDRYRPLVAARYFLERNYAVFVPMRQGFSKSEGSFVDGGCNVESNGRTQAEDIHATIAAAHLLPYVDRSRTVVVGQSHGGWTTLAYGASQPHESVKGLVNFAGGFRQDSCPAWENTLARAAGNLGADTKIPAIWFYADNDSYWPRTVSDAMFANYSAGNPKSTFVAYGTYERDGHSVFGDRRGRVIWEAHLARFLKDASLPYEPSNRDFVDPARLAAPAPSSFARIDEIGKVPGLSDRGKDGIPEVPPGKTAQGLRAESRRKVRLVGEEQRSAPDRVGPL